MIASLRKLLKPPSKMTALPSGHGPRSAAPAAAADRMGRDERAGVNSVLRRGGCYRSIVCGRNPGGGRKGSDWFLLTLILMFAARPVAAAENDQDKYARRCDSAALIRKTLYDGISYQSAHSRYLEAAGNPQDSATD